MPSVTFSIIIPSIGRQTLIKTLESLRVQLYPSDQVIVVFDGWPDVFLLKDVKRYRPTLAINPNGPSEDYGASARTLGQSMATKDVLLWMDDDDWYEPNALDAIRSHYAKSNGIAVFGMSGVDATCVEPGKISTQMVAIPRNATLGTWGKHYEGDYQFISQTVALNPDTPIAFLPECLVHYTGCNRAVR